MHYVTFYTAFDQYFQSVYPAVDMSVCVQNTTFPRSAGGGFKSHLVTALPSYTPAKQMFWGYTGISLSIRAYVHLCTNYYFLS